MFSFVTLIWLSVTAGALGQECGELSEPRETLAVAWVSPVRRQVMGSTWLEVVANRDMTAFVKREKPGVGRRNKI